MRTTCLRFILGVMGWSVLTAAHAGNVILLIGDGMGFEQVKAARVYAASPLSFEALPFQGEVTTASSNATITDSAAAATAMATGVKVNNGVVSLALPGDGSELETLVEYYKARGRTVGLVTTTYITHATPACFGAHETSRNNYSAIADDYLTQTIPNVLFGGGANGMSVSAAENAGYVVATTTASFDGLDTTADLLSAQFGTTDLPYEYDYLGEEYPYPHLANMVTVALDALDNDPDGFFLMVEGGNIDHACHANNLRRAVHETLAFSDAVQTALDWAAGRDDTLIMVTADHETGGLTVSDQVDSDGYPIVSWTTGGHTGVNVPVYAWGQDAALVAGVLDNTEINAVCKAQVTAVSLAGAVHYYPGTTAIADATVALSGDGSQSTVSESDGSYGFRVLPERNYRVTPNAVVEATANRGVDTMDIIAIRKHLLGHAYFDSAYQTIAADVDGSEEVDTLDIVYVRKLILGKITSFPAGRWQFVPSDYPFSSSSQPWPFPNMRDYSLLTEDTADQDFVAMKLGDVDGTWVGGSSGFAPALAGAQGQTTTGDATESWVTFSMGQQTALPGQTVTIPVAVGGFREVNGVQFTLEWDPAVLEFATVGEFGLPGLGAGNFNPQTVQGRLAFCWEDPAAGSQTLDRKTVLFVIQFAIVGKPGTASALEFADVPTPRKAIANYQTALAGWQNGIVEVGLATELPPGTCRVRAESAGGYRIAFAGDPEESYVIQCADRLNDPNWRALATVTTDQLGFAEYLDVPATTTATRFYRLVKLP